MRAEVLGSRFVARVRAFLPPHNWRAWAIGAAFVVAYVVTRSSLIPVLAFAAVLVFFPSVSLGAAVLSANLRTGTPGLPSGLTFPAFPWVPSGLTFPDVFLGLFLLGWLRELAVSRRVRIPPKWIAWLIAFLAWAWFSLLIAHAGATALALARVTLYGVVFCGAVLRPTSRRILMVFLGFGILEAVVGLAGVTPRLGNRLLGTLGDPGQFGLLMLFTLSAVSLVRSKPVRRVLYAIVVLAVAATLTRAVWIGGLIESVLLAVPRVTRRMLSAIVVASLVFIVAVALQGVVTQRLGLNVSSLPYRQHSWAVGIQLIKARPIAGYGWASGVPTPPSPYNLWINVAVSTGIVGALLLAAFMFCMTRHCFRRRGDPTSFFGFTYLAGFTAVSLGEMTVFAAGPATITLFVVMGLVVGSSMPVTAEGSPADPPRAGDEVTVGVGREG